MENSATRARSMTIYDAAVGPYPARVRIALAEKKLASQVRFVPIRLGKGEHKTPAFLTKNYSGTVPVLELEDGTYISECLAITEYLDALDGEPVLTGRTPLEKGLILMMSRRAELEVLDPISVYFHHATRGLGPEVELYQNADWGLSQRDKALRGMHYFNAILERQPFLTEAGFTMADITLIGGLIFADLVKLSLPESCTALSTWYAKMQSRPSVQNRVTMSADSTHSAA